MTWWYRCWHWFSIAMTLLSESVCLCTLITITMTNGEAQGAKRNSAIIAQPIWSNSNFPSWKKPGKHWERQSHSSDVWMSCWGSSSESNGTALPFYSRWQLHLLPTVCLILHPLPGNQRAKSIGGTFFKDVTQLMMNSQKLTKKQWERYIINKLFLRALLIIGHILVINL